MSETEKTLHKRVPHPHQPRNVNETHAAERGDDLNTRVAVWLTAHVGSMTCAYVFAIIAIFGLLSLFGILPPLVAALVAWGSQTFIQLTLLPVIMVGQNVLNRRAELQADEMFGTTQRTYHDIEQVLTHLSAQDAELLKQTTLLVTLAGHTTGDAGDQRLVTEAASK